MSEHRVRLLASTLLLLVIVRTGLLLMRFTRLRRLLDRWVGVRATSDGASALEIGRAVSAIGRRLPGTTCLAEALVADTLLRRNGHAPLMRIGVRRQTPADSGAALTAHAWVECGGAVLVGARPSLDDYVILDQAPDRSDGRT